MLDATAIAGEAIYRHSEYVLAQRFDVRDIEACCFAWPAQPQKNRVRSASSPSALHSTFEISLLRDTAHLRLPLLESRHFLLLVMKKTRS